MLCKIVRLSVIAIIDVHDLQQEQTPLCMMPVPACLQHPLSTRLYARAPQPQPQFSSVRSRPQSANSPRPQKRSRCRASTEAQTDEQSEVQIEGIDQNFCDDFVCTSSPAVERNLRALARDVVRTSTWTADLFADEVRYKDKFRSTEGIAQYKRQTYLAGAVKDPKVLVTKLRMLSRDVGAVSYRMRGSIATVPVDIDFEDIFELNLLTGRVLKHTESWELGRCSLTGKAAFIASRLIWAARQQASDTKDGGSRIMESLSSMDEGDQQGFQQNPDDPTRFFQGPPDNGNKDLIQGALIVAVLYLIYNTYSQIENIK